MFMVLLENTSIRAIVQGEVDQMIFKILYKLNIS